MHWFAYAILLLLCLGGIFITLLGLPGLWAMVLVTLVYAWYTSFHYIGLWTVLILMAIAGVAELIEVSADRRLWMASSWAWASLRRRASLP